MAELDTGIIAAIVLGSLLLLLVFAFLTASVFMMRRKRLLCFKREDITKPFLRTNKGLEQRHGAWKKQNVQPYNKKRKRKGRSKKTNYQSLGRPPKFPKRDLFAGKLLENPLVTSDDLDADWSNPAFDMQGAVIRDAATTIQSWYRMIRYRPSKTIKTLQLNGCWCISSLCRLRVPYVQLRESVILVQALYRGRKSRRRLPKYRKEKAARDVRGHYFCTSLVYMHAYVLFVLFVCLILSMFIYFQQLRKKQPGWKKQGTLAGKFTLH